MPLSSSNVTPRNRWSRRKRAAVLVAGAVLAWFVAAYVVAPLLWKRYEHRHPWLDEVPAITQTQDGIPGDPLNVSLVGTEQEVQAIMEAAGWHPADPLGLRSDLRIGADAVLGRPYQQAPVSNLYLFGRKEDLAFEQPVGDNPRKRHHVRWWHTEKPDDDGRLVWLGSVTYDERVGLSYTTGEITHHIESDVDAERDRLFQGLEATGRLSEVETVDDFHKVRQGRNGGGDPWHTDGRLFVGVIAAK